MKFLDAVKQSAFKLTTDERGVYGLELTVDGRQVASYLPRVGSLSLFFVPSHRSVQLSLVKMAIETHTTVRLWNGDAIHDWDDLLDAYNGQG